MKPQGCYSFASVSIQDIKKLQEKDSGFRLPFPGALANRGAHQEHLATEFVERELAFDFSEQPKLAQTQSAEEKIAQAGTSLSSLPASIQSRKREQRLLKTFNDIDVKKKGFLDKEDLLRFARENSLPEEYLPSFMSAVLADKQPGSLVRFDRFRRFVTKQEKCLRQSFDRLDLDGCGAITPRNVAAGLANTCFACPHSRCSYKCTPKAVQRLLALHSTPGPQQPLSFKEFRRLFLLLPQSDMLVEYWLWASAPALCDVGGCVVVRDAAPAKGSPWGHLLAGAAAGVTSRTATAPLETVRLQAMTGAGSAEGPIAAARQILRQGGWTALYRGNLLNVLRSAPQKALDFFAFDVYKGLLGAKESKSMLLTFLAAGLAGATSTAVLHPLEVMRSRLTCDVTGQYRGIASAARQIVRAEGFGALYRGLGPSMLAILPEAAITYGMFDGLKRSYARVTGREDADLLPSIAFGVMSAFTGQMVAFPLESVARRLQVQKQAARSVGVFAVIHQVVQKDGPLALYRGVGAAALRVVPMAFVSFTTYEIVRLWVTSLEEARAREQVEQTNWRLTAPYGEFAEQGGMLPSAAGAGACQANSL